MQHRLARLQHGAENRDLPELPSKSGAAVRSTPAQAFCSDKVAGFRCEMSRCAASACPPALVHQVLKLQAHLCSAKAGLPITDSTVSSAQRRDRRPAVS